MKLNFNTNLEATRRSRLAAARLVKDANCENSIDRSDWRASPEQAKVAPRSTPEEKYPAKMPVSEHKQDTLSFYYAAAPHQSKAAMLHKASRAAAVKKFVAAMEGGTDDEMEKKRMPSPAKNPPCSRVKIGQTQQSFTPSDLMLNDEAADDQGLTQFEREFKFFQLDAEPIDFLDESR
ncbi:hypothetical protein [Variovorax saccharolyticus]|uniref:hypothetical protein n=1 Tax=Variovorax saccharolyticus TaxID=3053516 RepID=UPI002578B20A|nr:hypothetical protein [Variovorax sp. J31P216]MDM0030380.1 hypothetical protein [Variovorax sp. J31P216]